ncbi:hypothetical protein D3C86_1237880 [compost metagenome]
MGRGARIDLLNSSFSVEAHDDAISAGAGRFIETAVGVLAHEAGLLHVASSGLAAGQPGLQRRGLLGRLGEFAGRVDRGQLEAGRTCPARGGFLDAGAVGVGATDLIDDGAVIGRADNSRAVDDAVHAGLAGIGFKHSGAIVVDRQGAHGADLCSRILGAGVLRRGGEDQAVRGRRRGGAQDDIAGARGAGDFVE